MTIKTFLIAATAAVALLGAAVVGVPSSTHPGEGALLSGPATR